jgi:hypothetical protein
MTLQQPEGSKPDRRAVLKALAVATLPKLTQSITDLRSPSYTESTNYISCSKATQQFFDDAVHLKLVSINSLPEFPADVAVAERPLFISKLRDSCLAAIRKKHGDSSIITRMLQTIPVEYDPTEERLIAESRRKIELRVKRNAEDDEVINSDLQIYQRFGSEQFFPARPPFYLRTGKDGLQTVPRDGRITIDQFLSQAPDQKTHPSGRHQFTSCALARVAFSCVAIGTHQKCGPVFITDHAFEAKRTTIELAEVLLHEYLHVLQISGGFSLHNNKDEILPITPELLNKTMGVAFNFYPQTIELLTEIQAYAFANKIAKGVESREGYNKQRLELSLLQVERSCEIIAPRNPSLYRKLIESLVYGSGK